MILPPIQATEPLIQATPVTVPARLRSLLDRLDRADLLTQAFRDHIEAPSGEKRIQTTNVDQIRVDQKTVLRFPAFHKQFTPNGSGRASRAWRPQPAASRRRAARTSSHGSRRWGVPGDELRTPARARNARQGLHREGPALGPLLCHEAADGSVCAGFPRKVTCPPIVHPTTQARTQWQSW